jgi:hypothetical protein
MIKSRALGRRIGRAILLSSWVLGILLSGIGTAQARDLCESIKQLIDQSHAGFLDIMDEPDTDAGDHDVNLILTDASYCRVTKTSKRSSYHCGWEFPHRAQTAYDAFDDFARRVDRCIGQHAAQHSDQSVNHPDTHALRRFETPSAEVSVSVKDKSALGRTFVFIRIQDRQNN